MHNNHVGLDMLGLFFVAVAEECRKCLDEDLEEDDLKTVFQVWDICGHEVFNFPS